MRVLIYGLLLLLIGCHIGEASNPYDVAVQPPPPPLVAEVAPAPTGLETKDGPTLDEPLQIDAREPAPMTKLNRYPKMVAPGAIKAGTEVSILVSLTDMKPRRTHTPQEVDGSTNPDGALVLTLPADEEEWILDVLLQSVALDVVDGDDMKQIVLRREGDSSVAHFRVRLQEHQTALVADLTATVLYGGDFMAELYHELKVRPVSDSTLFAIHGGASKVYDSGSFDASLTVLVDEKGATIGHGRRRKTEAFYSAAWDRAVYRDLLDKEWKALHARSSDPAEQAIGAKLRSLDGLGGDLWKVVPAKTQQFLLSVHNNSNVETLLVRTNSPEFPWELVRPRNDNGDTLSPLGERFAMARAHRTDINRDLATARIPLLELAAVFPEYAGSLALPALERERRALEAIDGYGRVSANINDVNALLEAPPSGVLHFAGHGKAQNQNLGRDYVIQLEDGSYDARAFRGLPDRPFTKCETLVFFNACELGQGEALSQSLVEGWAPAIMEAGADGFIGALWPVGDEHAAAFARAFYAEVDTSLKATGEARVSDILRCLRGRGRLSQSATWQAYIFYGRPDTVLTRPMSPGVARQSYICAI